MSAQHTPGPWEVRASGVFLRVVHGEHKITVSDGIVSETNARLIAAAPELLAALSVAVKWLAISDDPRCEKDLHAAEDALVKALGGFK